MLNQTRARRAGHRSDHRPDESSLALALPAAARARAAGALLPQRHETAAALLGALGRVGYALHVDGEQLRARGPAGALTPELRAAIAEQKPALLALLTRRAHPCARCGQHTFPAPGTVCAWCRRDPARLAVRHDGGTTDGERLELAGDRANASADTHLAGVASPLAAGAPS